MTVDDLKMLVSEAVRRAELLQDLGSPGAREAWRELSQIEEKLAHLQPADSAGGGFARRGAIHAAIQARDFDRAEALLADFRAEGESSARLVEPLAALLTEHLAAVQSRFPYAARQHGWSEVRRFSRLVAERGGRPLMVA